MPAKSARSLRYAIYTRKSTEHGPTFVPIGGVPFGGIKESGYGRELSCYGIREFINIKTAMVA